MSVGPRFLAVLVLSGFLVSPAFASAGWTITGAYHLPPAPDHEQYTTFHATVGFANETASINGNATNGTGTNGTGTNGTGTNGTGTNGTGTNGTGTNGTGTNGTGTNGTGTNGTGTNGTGTNITVNVTGCDLVIETGGNQSGAPAMRINMTREGTSNDFWYRLGPWPPGTSVLYHYEANLSNGTVLRSNSSWARTPDLLSVKWHHSPDEATRLAQELGRPLMVFVYSGFARSTGLSDGQVFARPGVVGLSAGFVCLRIDNETSPGFGQEHGLRRLPALVFINASTKMETARLENPLDGPLVEKEMRYLLGMGPRPSVAPESGPGYRVEAIALGTALVAGPVAMFLLLRFGRRKSL